MSFGINITSDIPGIYYITYPTGYFYDRFMNYFATVIFNQFIPITITFIYFMKAYKVLKTPYYDFVEQSQHPPKIYWYPTIQILCFLPGIIANTYFVIEGAYLPMVFGLVVATLHRWWGFLNLVAFWFVKPKAEEEDEEQPDQIDRTYSLKSAVY